jgi:hypothetical protein
MINKGVRLALLRVLVTVHHLIKKHFDLNALLFRQDPPPSLVRGWEKR